MRRIVLLFGAVAAMMMASSVPAFAAGEGGCETDPTTGLRYACGGGGRGGTPTCDKPSGIEACGAGSGGGHIYGTTPQSEEGIRVNTSGGGGGFVLFPDGSSAGGGGGAENLIVPSDPLHF